GGMALLAVPPLGLSLLIVAALVWWIIERHKRVFSLTSGKPMQEPRILLRLDSWQAVIRDLSLYADELKEGLLRELSTGSRITSEGTTGIRDTFHVREEDIWYPGIDGKGQRRQTGVRLSRALGFVPRSP